jgi:hypothetical protein
MNFIYDPSTGACIGHIKQHNFYDARGRLVGWEEGGNVFNLLGAFRFGLKKLE